MNTNSLHSTIRHKLNAVHTRIRTAMETANRTDNVRLVAISKFQPTEAIHYAALCGHVDFGENYLQEALEKQHTLQQNTNTPPLYWHFTGHIQSRKAKDIVGRFHLIHSLDSIKLANTIQKAAAQQNIQQAVLIQVNIGDETQKSGIHTSQVLSLAQHLTKCPNIQLQGLMCLPPVFDAGLAARPWFAQLRQLKEEIAENIQRPLPHLSMGMSGDLEAAILEGATLVRIGTDIFGHR